MIVRVTDVRNPAGTVVIGIWNSKDGFPKETAKAFRKATVAIMNGTATTTFADVPYSEYAIGVYHDENNNGKMDTRFPGIPVEGVGSSNNVHPRFSAPSFTAVSYTHLDVYKRQRYTRTLAGRCIMRAVPPAPCAGPPRPRLSLIHI